MPNRGEPSHLAALLRILSDHVRGDSTASRATGHPRAELEIADLSPSPRRLRRYLRATRGTEIETLETGAVLPPVYPALWETVLAIDLVRLARLPFPRRGVIHLGGERLYVRSSSAEEGHALRMRIERVETVSLGTRLTLGSRLESGAGRLCRQGEIHLLLAGISVPWAAPGSRQAETESVEPEKWEDVAAWRITGSAGRRYGRVSGDLNPIHLSRVTARLLGFRGPMLHGFCTEAMVAHALVERLFGGDPGALRRLRIRFPAPLVIPARVVLRVGTDPTTGYSRFRLTGPADGSRSYAEGEYVGSAAGQG